MQRVDRQRAIVKNKCEAFVRHFLPETHTVFKREAREQNDGEEMIGETIRERKQRHWQKRKRRGT